IEEAEEMADRIGVIDKGRLVLVEDKRVLMKKLGKKQLFVQLQSPLRELPPSLQQERVELSADGTELVFTFDSQSEHTGMVGRFRKLDQHGIEFRDLRTQETSLEEIFVSLVKGRP